jgi:hypothetical protein
MAWATGADVTYFQCATCRLCMSKMCNNHFALCINPLKEKFPTTDVYKLRQFRTDESPVSDIITVYCENRTVHTHTPL